MRSNRTLVICALAFAAFAAACRVEKSPMGARLPETTVRQLIDRMAHLHDVYEVVPPPPPAPVASLGAPDLRITLLHLP